MFQFVKTAMKSFQLSSGLGFSKFFLASLLTFPYVPEIVILYSSPYHTAKKMRQCQKTAKGKITKSQGPRHKALL